MHNGKTFHCSVGGGMNGIGSNDIQIVLLNKEVKVYKVQKYYSYFIRCSKPLQLKGVVVFPGGTVLWTWVWLSGTLFMALSFFLGHFINLYISFPCVNANGFVKEPIGKIRAFNHINSACLFHFDIKIMIKDTWYLTPEKDCERDFHAVSELP